MRTPLAIAGLLAITYGLALTTFANDNAATEKKVSALGTIQPEMTVDIGAQVPGVIASLGEDPHNAGKPVDFGTEVEVGTVLAKIRSDIYAARVIRERANCAHAEADLEVAKVEVEIAELNQERLGKLQKSAGTPELEDARLKCKKARAVLGLAATGVEQSKSALKLAELDMSYTTIRSPIKGVILDRCVNVGHTVSASLASPTLFLVGTGDRLQIWASVKEADIKRIHSGQEVRFGVEAYPGRVFEGKVKQIRLNATMVKDEATYTVVITMPKGNGELLPYMSAKVDFQ